MKHFEFYFVIVCSQFVRAPCKTSVKYICYMYIHIIYIYIYIFIFFSLPLHSIKHAYDIDCVVQSEKVL